MRRPSKSFVVLAAAGALVAGVLTAATTNAAPAAPRGSDRLEVYVGEMPVTKVTEVVDLGVDRHELELRPVSGQGEDAVVEVEAILSAADVQRLRSQGIRMAPKRIDGQTVTQRATAAAAEGYEVFRTYSGEGGLREEYEQVAQDNPKITKLVSIGETVNGQDIVALKVTKNARQTRDGKRPSVLYMSAQHAREWITPEMNRRLMHYVVDGYSSNSQIRRLLDKTELWFVPVANPDGYDFTFQPGQRLWRKNLRDNNGDGVIAPGDGVDLNRNWDFKWGYDNEGSSPAPGSETYRGPGPNSEPETQAMDRFARRIGFEFVVNYHSAAELLLYGTGWQVATPTPDDTISEAMAGDDAEPAVPGYDPDISAELYTTNGDTDSAIGEKYGALGFTPEMSTCEAASQSVPDDEWVDTDCDSGFNFPDDEGLVQAEFLKNIPFALSVAQSADDPDDPESVVGREAPNFVVDSFDVSYGSPQKVAVVAKRALGRITMYYRINDGRVRSERATEWRGGERYGNENDEYYAEFRAQVRGADEGDDVMVWFGGQRGGGHGDRGRPPVSEPFTYTVESDTGHDVLLIANEDYTGVNPTYPAEHTAPKYDDAHVAAIEDAGYSVDVWDVDAQGVPHDLGVLSPLRRPGVVPRRQPDHPGSRGRAHHDAARGTCRTSRSPSASSTSPWRCATTSTRAASWCTPARPRSIEGLPASATRSAASTTASTVIPTAECVIVAQPNSATAGFFEDCLIMADDFRQYYLGGFSRTSIGDVPGAFGTGDPITGFEGSFGGPATVDNPLDEAGVFQATSNVLPPDEFPQFDSHEAAVYPIQGGPFAPVEGTRFAGVLHADDSYARLTRDVVSVPAGATSAELQLPAVVRHGGCLRPCARGSQDGRSERLDDPAVAAGKHRVDDDGSAGRVRSRWVPPRAAPVPRQLPGR